MARSGKSEELQVVEGEHLPANPARLPRLRLGSIREVRRELIKVYGLAKAGRLPTQDASRLVFMLQALAGMIKDHELEQRIQVLEQRQEHEKTRTQNCYS